MQSLPDECVAFYISTTEGEREPLETLLIKSLQPKQNRVGKPK